MNSITTSQRPRPDVRFDSPRVTLSARICRLMELAPGDTLGLASGDGETWLYVLHHHTARWRNSLYPTCSRSKHQLRCSDRQLCAKVSELTGSQRSWLMAGFRLYNIDVDQVGKVPAVPLIIHRNLWQDKPNSSN